MGNSAWAVFVAIVLAFVLFAAPGVASIAAPAFPIIAPNEVNISGTQGSFIVEVSNLSLEPKDLKVNFFSTLKNSISAPTRIAPNSTAQVKITLENTYTSYTEINSTLEVFLGSDFQRKEIVIKFVPQGSGAFNDATSGLFGAFFSFGTFLQELTNFSLLEWGVFWVLVIIAAILLIAFIARVRRKV